MQKIAMMAAMSLNRVIGANNKVVWDMPADIANFWKIAKGKAFIMGRKSYEAPDKLLSDYKNIILSRSPIPDLCNNCQHAESPEKALDSLKEEEEVLIMGGDSIFHHLMPVANYIYLTLIHHIFEGDSFFPEISEKEWKMVKDEFHKADAENPYDYSFREYKRKS